MLRAPHIGATTGSVHADASLRPTSAWHAAGGATEYELQVDDSCQTSSFETCVFASPEIDQVDVSATMFTLTTSLAVSLAQPVGRRYFWRVRACNDIGCSAWSDGWYLDVGRLADDVNGDGYGDLAIGMVPQSTSATTVGAAYLAFGRATGAVTLTKLDGQRSDAPFAGALAIVGDVNADGYADVVVGSPTADNTTYLGSAFLYLGRGTWPADVTKADTELGLAPADPDTNFGGAVTGRGDINGDGYTDFAVSSVHPLFGGQPTAVGYAHVFFGRPTWSFAQLGSDLVVPDPVGDENGGFGTGLTMGDLDDDGLADLVVGAPEANGSRGAASVYYGHTSYPSDPQILSTPDFSFAPIVASGSIAGLGAAPTTCASSHGPAAIALGSPVESHPAANEGVERIHSGRAPWTDPITTADATLVDPDGALNGELGIAARCADVTGDGNDDLVVGAPTGDDAGSVYVYADADALPSAPMTTLLNTTTANAGIVGSSIGVTDFNGDGVMDVFAGAPRLPTTNAGRVLGWFGRTTWQATIMGADVTIDNPSGIADEWFGRTLD